MQDHKHKREIFILISQIISALVLGIYLMPKFIIANDPEIIPSLQQVAEPVTLSISPKQGTFYVGDTIQIQILVHTPQQAINAVGVRLVFPQQAVEIIKIGKNDSLCSLFPEEKIDNNSGLVIYSCGLPTPGFTGNHGLVGTFYVKFKKQGFVNLAFREDSQVLANDGFGTNILTRTIGAGFNIIKEETVEEGSDQQEVVAKEVGPIKVISDTHPNQLEWYNKNKVILSWEEAENVLGYSFTLDRASDTEPDPTILYVSKKVEYNSLDNGVWYFHIMGLGESNIEGPVSHFKIQIDTVKPDMLEVSSVNFNEENNEWEIELASNDQLSGIASFEVMTKNGVPVQIDKKATLSSGTFPSDKIQFTVYDYAGNSLSIEYDLPRREPKSLWEEIVYYFYLFLDFLRNL